MTSLASKLQANRAFDEGAYIEKEGAKLIDKIANHGSGENKGKHADYRTSLLNSCS